MLRKFLGLFRSDTAPVSPQSAAKITIIGGAPTSAEADGNASGSPRVSTFGPDINVEEFLSGGKDVYVPPDVVHHNREGLAPLSAAQLIQANRALIDQALQSFTHKHLIPDFDKHIMQLVRRVAHWMGPFPASRGHHHPNRGGLFTHSIGVAVASLHMSVAKNVTIHSSPRDRDADGLAWQLICFIGGLLHDIGKLNTTGRIYPHSVANKKGAEGEFLSSAAPVYAQPWEPMVEGFEAWVEANDLLSYYIDFDVHETLPHRDFTARYIMALVPRPLLAFVYNSNNLVRTQFEDFIRNPESAAQTPIFTVVRDADHMNVALSIDPRRRPGSAEMSALVIRRFHEFASEAAWNLPNSPFIYAHVEHETDQGIRYYGVPFFVASEASIQDFISYLTSKPLMGVSFGQHIREIVFNTLEASYVMNRTLELLLPEQIKLDELQDYVPASKGVVRFRARDIESIMKPINGQIKDALIELAVIPIGIKPAASVTLRAPTLSFNGAPESASAVAIPVAIDNGKIGPADSALMHDAEFMQNFKGLVRDHGLSEQEARQLASVGRAVSDFKPSAPPAVNPKLAATISFEATTGAAVVEKADGVLKEASSAKRPAKAASKPATPSKTKAPAKPKAPAKAKAVTTEAAKAPAKPAAKKKAVPAAKASEAAEQKADTPTTIEEAAGQGGNKGPKQVRPSDKKEAASAKPSSGKPGVAAEPTAFTEVDMALPELDDDAPPWQFAYAALNTLSADERRHMFWAFFWLYLRDNPAQTVHPILNGKGGYALRGTSIPKSYREGAVGALKEAGLHIGHLSKHWPSNPLRLDHDTFKSTFSVSKPNDDGLTTVDLGADCSAMIDQQLQAELDAGGSEA